MLLLVSVQRVAGYHAYAQTTGDGLLDGFIAAQFQPYIRAEFLSAEKLVGCHARAGTRFAQDEAVLGQILQRYLAASCQRIVAGDNHHDGVGHEALVAQFDVGRRHGHDVRSSRLSRRRCTTPSRLRISSDTSMAGWRLQKLPIRRGIKYLAVLTTATRSLPRESLDAVHLLLETIPALGNGARRCGQFLPHLRQMDFCRSRRTGAD
jgi:hypothetical protein